MRPLKQLPFDLNLWVIRGKEAAKKEIATTVLSEINPPVLTGFLAAQGYVFIDGNLAQKTPGVSSAPKRVAIAPEGGYDADISVVYKAGRPRDGEPFDYAYYVGVTNPGHLRNALNKFWIEAALSPGNPSIRAAIDRGFIKAYGTV